MIAFTPQETRSGALARLASALQEAGLPEARSEARHVLLAALRTTPADMLLNPDSLLGAHAADLTDAARRRIAREPLARISGQREFYGLAFTLCPATLIPRPDTETLVDAVLDHARLLGLADRPIRILDLGTGSGAILAALLSHLPQASGLATDIAPEAVATAAANLARHAGARGKAVLSDWFGAVDGRFDIIVSNPPYIPTADIAGLEPEVARHDPVLALDGGADGLDAYRVILAKAPAHLAPGGLLALECGIGQAGDLAALAGAQGFTVLEIRDDLGGIQRVLMLRQPF